MLLLMVITAATIFHLLTDQVELNSNSDLFVQGTWFESPLEIWPF
jgi:hypothetical protein